MVKSRRRWAEHVARMGEKMNAYRILVGKPERRGPLGRPRRRWVGNIEMDFREIGWDVDCPMEYIGQTGRKFNTRDKEHIHDLRHNNSNTGYSEDILNTGHAYGTIENTMDIIATNKKGQYLNTLENYHIYRTTRENTHMNNINKEIYNPIFHELHTIKQNNITNTPPPTPTTSYNSINMKTAHTHIQQHNARTQHRTQ
ncbi:hypothetical protein B7P43_G08714 [Cryptotermes secundus]|uniref:Uncharacterized protein n=1 Tax=Cryptotermes secundus TaxID=105785 RepID=A0A2J7QJB8_9NEOP|nr:hypothetical protein B7P43_G08714 [Cryptotermes secundus]